MSSLERGMALLYFFATTIVDIQSSERSRRKGHYGKEGFEGIALLMLNADQTYGLLTVKADRSMGANDALNKPATAGHCGEISRG